MTALGSQNGKTAPADPDQLRAEISRTRSELGETVEALAAKADVKARAHEGVENAKVRVRESVEQAKVNATQVGRELRADPVGSLRVTAQRTRRSVMENPRPWAVIAAFVVFAVVVGYRRRHR
jgi:hypothetical protein